MLLGTRGRYAVMALVELVRQSSDGKPVTLASLSEEQEISLSYLEQIFLVLRKKGLVQSVRGPGGGYVLARPAELTRIADIIMAVDEPIRMTRCQGKSGCMADHSRCLTHELWEGLGDHIYDYLSSISLADVCARNIPVLQQVREPKVGMAGHA